MSTALTLPAIPTPPQPVITEALIICCALAYDGNPLTGLDTHSGYAERIVRNTRHKRTLNDILSWRTHTDEATWDLRWSWARRVTRHHFPAALGIDDLPLDHNHAPRAATPTAIY